jgi:hypothetical protein
MGSSCKCKLFLPHRLVENTEVFIIRLRRSGKVKGSDIGIHSPGLHSSFSCYSALRLVNAALSSSNSCKLAAAQSMLGSFRYTSWSPKDESGLSRRIMAVGLRLRARTLLCLVCSGIVSHVRLRETAARKAWQVQAAVLDRWYLATSFRFHYLLISAELGRFVVASRCCHLD